MANSQFLISHFKSDETSSRMMLGLSLDKVSTPFVGEAPPKTSATKRKFCVFKI